MALPMSPMPHALPMPPICIQNTAVTLTTSAPAKTGKRKAPASKQKMHKQDSEDDDDDAKESDSNPDTSKKARRRRQNRVAAQTSREKKKRYLTNLETQVSELNQKNSDLLAQLQAAQEENKRLRGQGNQAPTPLPVLEPPVLEQAFPASEIFSAKSEPEGFAIKTEPVKAELVPIDNIDVTATIVSATTLESAVGGGGLDDFYGQLHADDVQPSSCVSAQFSVSLSPRVSFAPTPLDCDFGLDFQTLDQSNLDVFAV